MIKKFAPLFMLVAACGGGGDGDAESGAEHAYVLGSLVFGSDTTTSYVSVLDSLDPQTVDFDRAHEFSGSADVWVHGGAVFVADAETVTITKYALEGRDLVEQEAIGLSSYGITDFGFWRNTFVAEDKAYFSNGTAELIVWNPTTMLITGSIALPTLPAVGGLSPFPGYSDRAAIVRNGRLYQPIYFTDPSFFQYTPDSVILVVDIASDKVVDTLMAPCPGLDFASTDAAGNMYFSNWIYAAGGAAVLDQPQTCVYKVPADGGAPTATGFADMAGGHEGGALRFLPDGRTMFSVLYDEHDTSEPRKVDEVTYGPNWRFWSAPAEGSPATMIDAIDWSSGAHYTFEIDGRSYMLVAAGDYGSTTVYRIEGATITPTPLFGAMGWSTRLFKLR